MGSELFYVRVYKPAQVFEYEMEVDPDLIGLDDESEAGNADPLREALRLSIKRAKSGEGGEMPDPGEEYVALIWDECNRMSTHALLKSADVMKELRRMVVDPAFGLMPDVKEKFCGILNPLIGVLDEPINGSSSPGGTGQDRSGADSEARESEGSTSEGGGERGATDGGQRAAPGKRRARRVAPVQRRRRSRAGKGVDDES